MQRLTGARRGERRSSAGSRSRPRWPWLSWWRRTSSVWSEGRPTRSSPSRCWTTVGCTWSCATIAPTPSRRRRRSCRRPASTSASSRCPGSRSTVRRLVGIGLDHDAPGVDVRNGSRDVGGAPDEVFDVVVDPARFDGTVVLQVVPRAASREPREAVFSAFYRPVRSWRIFRASRGGRSRRGRWPRRRRPRACRCSGGASRTGWTTKGGYAFEPRAERPEGVVVHAWEGPISEPGVVQIPAGTLAVQVLPGTPDAEQVEALGLDPEPYLRSCPVR